MDASVNNFLGFASQSPQLKNGTEAIFGEAKNSMDAILGQRKG
jgi:hypothetical protein